MNSTVLQPGTLVKIKPEYTANGAGGYGYIVDSYIVTQEFTDMGSNDFMEYRRYKIWAGAVQDCVNCFEYEFVVVKD